MGVYGSGNVILTNNKISKFDVGIKTVLGELPNYG